MHLWEWHTSPKQWNEIMLRPCGEYCSRTRLHSEIYYSSRFQHLGRKQETYKNKLDPKDLEKSEEELKRLSSSQMNKEDLTLVSLPVKHNGPMPSVSPSLQTPAQQ